MAIQQLNTNEVETVSGAFLGNLGNGGLNPLGGLLNTLTNFDAGGFFGGLLTGVLGLLANPGILFQAADPNGVASVGIETLSDLFGNGLGL